ncbi:TraB/GumN family protein [Caulobacter segnis]|uniref:GumN family protein n=2 Tax=Caulobacter segnis TaxID=88688 RepID=D5VNN1_CAUST|nr:TraB/GumN family protein [Caulobacter segnis]ADG12104.1 GumN family protein [Caulobacter segnis ATCC 21756]AVQ03711.1 TraB/GumN family protein [Caulobacter segnis]
MRAVLTGLALSAAVMGSSANAQAIDDPQANVVEALVVSAKLPGPAWWRVSDGDTTIYVLGVPSALPKGQPWDRTVLERRLDGAFALLTPPVWQAGLTDIPAMLRLRNSLKDDGDWAARSPALAARTQRAWTAVDPKNADGWRRWKPLLVALQLNGKANAQAKLQTSQPDKDIAELARKKRVKARPAATHKAMPMLKSVVREHGEAAGLVCLSETLDATEVGAAPIRAAAQAWSQGRVKDALAGPRSAERCELLLPGVADLKRQLVDDEVEGLTNLLKTPGHAVAYFPLRALVAENGVLDKLRSRGITVRTPGEG